MTLENLLTKPEYLSMAILVIMVFKSQFYFLPILADCIWGERKGLTPKDICTMVLYLLVIIPLLISTVMTFVSK